MKNWKTFAILTGVAFLVMAGNGPAEAQQIKKCQDADGNWHYGNFADEACRESAVDELHETGVKIGTDLPPPSEEELERKARMEESEKLQKELGEDQRKRDLEVLRIYGNEETIITTRDRKLAAIDNNIDVTRQIKEGTLKDIEKLMNMKQTKKVKRQLEEREDAVASYNRVIRHNLTERERLSEQYISLLNEFREARKRVYGQ